MNDLLERRAFLTGAIGVGAAMTFVSANRALGQTQKGVKSQGDTAMSNDELRAFFGRYIEALNTHDMHRMTEFVHDKLTKNGEQVTRDDVIAELEGHVEAVPDFVWRVQDLAIEGDTVAARLFNIGTPAKKWLGLDPTGAKVEYAEFAFHKVRDGRFYEMNYAMDVLQVQRQLAR